MKQSNYKTIFLCVTIVTLFAFNQAAYAQPWIQGGNNTAPGNILGFVGTPNANLLFYTNGVENMRIDYTTGFRLCWCSLTKTRQAVVGV